MGSLPNLHELCNKDEQGHQILQHHKIGAHFPTSGGGQHEKSRSLYGRNTNINAGHQKVFKSKSNGHATHVCDDMMLEQMASYSPTSSRSTRNLTHNVIRRRDSLNSSIGATSVRRLIAVVRNTHGRYGPVYSRKLLVKNLVVLCISHVAVSVTFYSFLALQSSVSVWYDDIAPNNNTFIATNIHVGSLLIALGYLFAAFSTLLGPAFVQKFGTNAVLFVFHVIIVIFFASHFYPVLYVLVPVYVMFGLALGPVCISRITYLMTLSTKLNSVLSEDDDDSKQIRKTCLIRRVARSFQAAQDIGLIIGSVLTAVIIAYTFNPQQYVVLDSKINATFIGNTTDCVNNQTCLLETEANDTRQDFMNSTDSNSLPSASSVVILDYTTFMNNMFDVDETGDRLCGSKACPSYFIVSYNWTSSPSTNKRENMRVLPTHAADTLTAVFVGIALLAFFIAVMGLDRIRLYVPQDPLERPEGLAALKQVKESFKDFRLQLAAPLAVFIGMEQAFMFADFSKSYVVCTLGVERLNLVFLCMGLLQSIAACTLSMLLRSIQRYIVIAVGFAFHACLLMVQSLWKPSGDDPALFYVISAAWGVCNAIWEMLNFTLLTGLYGDGCPVAFANSYFFRHLGLAITFAVHGLLCNWLKLYVLAFAMVVSTVPLTWLEIKLEHIRKTKNISRL